LNGLFNTIQIVNWDVKENEKNGNRVPSRVSKHEIK